jgi:hypothetical protein
MARDFSRKALSITGCKFEVELRDRQRERKKNPIEDGLNGWAFGAQRAAPLHGLAESSGEIAATFGCSG